MDRGLRMASTRDDESAVVAEEECDIAMEYRLLWVGYLDDLIY
eukprot:SAG11_NODE_19654_length_461_cov_213.254144_1_plen_43_part_00